MTTPPRDLDEDLDFEDLITLLREDLETVIAKTLADRAPRTAREFAARVIDTDRATSAEDPDAAGLGKTALYLVLSTWIHFLREQSPEHLPHEGALRWIERTLGADCAHIERQSAELADTASKTDQVADELGEDFLPGLVWFATGLVAEYGQGDLAAFRDGPPPDLSVRPHEAGSGGAGSAFAAWRSCAGRQTLSS